METRASQPAQPGRLHVLTYWQGRLGVLLLLTAAGLVAMAWVVLLVTTVRRGWPPESWVAYDFRAFHGAAASVVRGLGGQMYDIPNQANGSAPMFVNPPFYALLMIPLGLLPVDPASALWAGLSIVLLVVGVYLLDQRKAVWTFPFVLFSAPALHATLLGQNTMMMFFFIALAYWALNRNSDVLSGMALGIVSAKPQLISGILVFLAIRWKRNRVILLGFFGTLVALGTASFLAVPDAWRRYPALVTSLSGVYSGGTTPHQDLGMGRAITMAFPEAPSLAGAIGAIGFALVVVVCEVWFLRESAATGTIGFAMGVLVSVMIAPHMNRYDWLLLAVPLILLWSAVPTARSTWLLIAGVLSWTALLSPWIVEAQLDAFGRALSPALPVLVVAAVAVGRTVLVSPTSRAPVAGRNLADGDTLV